MTQTLNSAVMYKKEEKEMYRLIHVKIIKVSFFLQKYRRKRQGKGQFIFVHINSKLTSVIHVS